MSVGRSFFLRERQIRKQLLLKMIRDNPEMVLPKLKGLFSMKTGLTFKKIDEYLSELEQTGLINKTKDHAEAIKLEE